MPRPVIRRHDLVQIAVGDWAGACAAWVPGPHLAPEQVAAVTGWAAARRPAITRRPLPGDAPDRLAVGVPLPPSLGKLRVALSVPLEAQWRRCGPLELVDAAISAPEKWRDTITSLRALGRTLGLRPRVFGALLWQHVTGLSYLHAGSDLDLLWVVGTTETVASLLDGLQRIDENSPVRIDGEVRTPGGDVSWRDLAGARTAGGTVLVKTGTKTFLESSAALFAEERTRC